MVHLWSTSWVWDSFPGCTQFGNHYKQENRQNHHTYKKYQKDKYHHTSWYHQINHKPIINPSLTHQKPIINPSFYDEKITKARCPAFWWSLALWAFSEVTRTVDKASWNTLPTKVAAKAANVAKGGAKRGKPWVNHGKTMGKPWETQKSMGKPCQICWEI